MKRKELKESYLEEVLKCEKVLSRLNRRNLSAVTLICKEALDRLREVESGFAEDKKYAMHQEVFSINRQALELLLEYSDVFDLVDYYNYKKHCLTLFRNFRSLLDVRLDEFVGNIHPDYSRQNINTGINLLQSRHH